MNVALEVLLCLEQPAWGRAALTGIEHVLRHAALPSRDRFAGCGWRRCRGRPALRDMQPTSGFCPQHE
eukprot:13641054-Alexandrium_andersonii.AAC.1